MTSAGSTGLLTDRYELTMLAAALADGTANRRCTFEVFARRLPDGRRYGVVAGTARLLEAISRFRFTDAELSSMLRTVREPELIEAKSAAARVVLDTCLAEGGRVEVTLEQADAWLASLNDVRLALGTTLGVTEDMPEDLPDDPALAAHMGVYQWLTFVQDALVQTWMQVR